MALWYLLGATYAIYAIYAIVLCSDRRLGEEGDRDVKQVHVKKYLLYARSAKVGNWSHNPGN